MLDLAADWLITQFALENSGYLSQEEAMTWVRAAYLRRAGSGRFLPNANTPVDASLETLTQHAVRFAQELAGSERLRVTDATGQSDMLLNVATAWLLTEVAKRGLAVDTNQIAAAVVHELQKQHRLAGENAN